MIYVRHWREPTERQVTVARGRRDKRKAYPIKDLMTGEIWYVKINPKDSAVALGQKYKSHGKYKGRYVQVKEAKYSEKQYELIRWSLWAMDQGWSIHEIYAIIKPMWKLYPGQQPLSPVTIHGWKRQRKAMYLKGLIWP